MNEGTHTIPSDQPPPTGSSLPLPALDVRGYRTLTELAIGRLARVNLITGKNNVGKSSLLESIHLLASRGSDRSLMDVLASRGYAEFAKPHGGLQGATGFQSKQAALVFARSVLLTDYVANEHQAPIFLIGVPDSAQWLLTRFGWYREIVGSDGSLFREFTSRPDGDAGICLEVAAGKLPGRLIALAPASADDDFKRFVERESSSDKVTINAPPELIEKRLPALTSRFFPSSGLDPALVGQLWNDIVLSPTEADVVAALQLIDPRVERCALIGSESPVPHVLLKGMKHPLPLSAMGDGMGRLFNLALVMTSAQGGVVTLDEIDNGIHYTVMPQMWTFILDLAERLNVQVFATTHGRDCVEAFHQALAGREPHAGQVIKLFRSKASPHRVEAACFGQDRLTTALSSDLEVR